MSSNPELEEISTISDEVILPEKVGQVIHGIGKFFETKFRAQYDTQEKVKEVWESAGSDLVNTMLNTLGPRILEYQEAKTALLSNGEVPGNFLNKLASLSLDEVTWFGTTLEGSLGEDSKSSVMEVKEASLEFGEWLKKFGLDFEFSPGSYVIIYKQLRTYDIIKLGGKMRSVNVIRPIFYVSLGPYSPTHHEYDQLTAGFTKMERDTETTTPFVFDRKCDFCKTGDEFEEKTINRSVVHEGDHVLFFYLQNVHGVEIPKYIYELSALCAELYATCSSAEIAQEAVSYVNVLKPLVNAKVGFAEINQEHIQAAYLFIFNLGKYLGLEVSDSDLTGENLYNLCDKLSKPDFEMDKLHDFVKDARERIYYNHFKYKVKEAVLPHPHVS